MINRNINQCGTETAGSDVMIGWYSLHSRQRGHNRHPEYVGGSFRYTSDELINHSNQRLQRRK